NLLYPENSTFIKVMAAKYPSYAEYNIDSALKLIKNPFKIDKKNKDYYKDKIILLVNSSTTSMSEFFAMPIQNSLNCTTLSEQTFGAVMNRMAVPLKDGTSIDTTGFRAFYPDDTSVQRKGLKIDHYLKKNTKNYKDDFYIEEALKLIDHSL
ncbi:S41 family peptidase, partial [Zunongwangia profunda]